VGRFVAFEGIDGSGKTTVAKAVHDALASRGLDVVLTSEPTRTWAGEAVRTAIGGDTEAVTESFLFLADRAAHTAEIRGWLGQGKTVLCDRYTDSTLAYQGARLEGTLDHPIAWLRTLSARVAIEPDLTLLLRITPATGLRRIAERGRLVRFEEAAFLEKVAANYDALATADPRCRAIDADRPLASVVSDALTAIDSL